jgi:N-methylhydantoinase A
VRVAGAEMAGAVRVMTVERGIDPRDLALLAFGGAGPLHACSIAEELGMRRVVVPQASGVLSALGLIVSERRRDLVESVLLSGEELTRETIAEAVERLAARGREELEAGEAEVRAGYDLRYAGQAFELTVAGDPSPDPGELRRAFDRAHEQRYGYSDSHAVLELVTVRVSVALPGGELAAPPAGERAEPRTREAVFGGERMETAVLRGGFDEIRGPAVCELREATLVVPPGWSGAADGDGTIALEREA